MRVYLMRHGIAIDREDPACPPDPQRQLTPEGIAKTRAVAQGLRALGLKPGAVLSSPYVRAVQTAEIACEALGVPVTRIRHTDALKPEGDAAQLLRELIRLRANEIMCFGHAPNLDEVIGHTLGCAKPITALKKAGVACLEVEARSTPGGGLLVWILTPKVLRRLSA